MGSEAGRLRRLDTLCRVRQRRPPADGSRSEGKGARGNCGGRCAMISPQEIEALAVKHVDLEGEDDAKAFSVIEHLDGDDFDAVLTCAEGIRFDRNMAEGDPETLIRGAEALVRLANATGCPDGEPIVPWLQEHGCAVEGDDGELRFKMPGPGAVATSRGT